jgi:uncharacterized coiled-coil protein SlyX
MPPQLFDGTTRAAELERALAGRDERIAELALALVDERDASTALRDERDELKARLADEREHNAAHREYLEGELESTSQTLEMVLDTRAWKLAKRWYAMTRKIRGRY